MANSSLNLPQLQNPGPECISAQDLAEQLGSKRVAVIDAREPMEFAGGHIASHPVCDLEEGIPSWRP